MAWKRNHGIMEQHQPEMLIAGIIAKFCIAEAKLRYRLVNKKYP
jgi:hypothetical protein